MGGLSTVGITGQLLVDGSITADKLTVNSLSALTANAGTINGGTFKTHTLDAHGNVVDPREFRVELTNVGEFPLWIGTAEKNHNNAVFWVDRLGNAGFAGRVSAPNITGTLQRISLVNWQGGGIDTVPSTGGKELTRFSLAAPVLQGEAHVPVFCLAVNVQSRHGDNGVFRLHIERLQGAQWVLVSATQLNQGSGMGINHALNAIGPASTTAETYRVVAFDVERGINVSIQGVTGYVFGLR